MGSPRASQAGVGFAFFARIYVWAQIGGSVRFTYIPKGCLKLNINDDFKDGQAAIMVLARDEGGRVKGLWFEKKQFTLAMEAEAKALFNVCAKARDQNYVKVIIKSDCRCYFRLFQLSLACFNLS